MATALSRFDLLGHARHLLYNYSQVTIMYGRSPKRFAGLCQKKPLLISGFCTFCQACVIETAAESSLAIILWPARPACLE